MPTLHLKVQLLIVFIFAAVPLYCQIEDPLRVDQIIEHENLSKLYSDFPNAMNLYKESKTLKLKGISMEGLGLGMTIAGGYILIKGIVLKRPDNNSGVQNLPDYTNLRKIGLICGGAILGSSGILIFRSGSRKLSMSKEIRRGSAQQYIWDLEARTKTQKQDLGTLSIGINDSGVGLLYVF